MKDKTQMDPNDIDALAEEARALLDATAHVAGEKVAEARQRLAAALDQGKEVYGRIKDKAAEAAKVADKAVRENPYQAMVLALGIGAVIGYLLGRRNSNQGD